MSQTSPVTDLDLHAYVDDELSPRRKESVKAYLAASPEAFSRVASWRINEERLRAAFDDVSQEPLPLRLKGGKVERRIVTVPVWRMMALFVGGVATGVFLMAVGMLLMTR